MRRMAILLFAISCSSLAEGPPKYPPFPDAARNFADFQKAIPKNGLITDENMAKAIGKAALEAQFGVGAVEELEPLQVQLEHDYWVISTRPPSAFTFGGGFTVVIAQRDGRILYLNAGK